MDGTAGYMHGTAGYMVENSENSVCPRPLLQFLQFFFSFFSLSQLGYIKLRQFMLEGRDVELDNYNNVASILNFPILHLAYNIIMLPFHGIPTEQ